MTCDLNKVMIIGRVGSNPVRELTAKGTITRFSVATNDRWTTKEGHRSERTTWFKIITFDGLANLCHEMFKQGSLVYIEGSFQIHRYQDRQGIEREGYLVRAREVRHLGSAKREAERDIEGRESAFERPSSVNDQHFP